MEYYQELEAALDSNLSIVYVQSRNIQIAEFTAQDFLPSTHPVSDHTIILMHELLLTQKKFASEWEEQITLLADLSTKESSQLLLKICWKQYHTLETSPTSFLRATTTCPFTFSSSYNSSIFLHFLCFLIVS